MPVLSSEEVLAYLAKNEKKDLLRLVAVGSVDDGKSTLIGRLLHDSHGVYEDQLRAVKRASGKGADIDYSLFTDGLKAEREQGITIDVAYRYFATAKRKFIIADTPGHVQYTRNMATGASTADVAVILVDARLGVLPQSRRHAYIASLLGIPHLLVGVNKMDLVAFSSEIYGTIKKEFSAFADKLRFRDVRFIPLSARDGDNVVTRSERTPFYDGPTLLEHLEEVELADDAPLGELRFPVQTVVRPNLDYRGYAGQLASGVVRRGDAVMILPSRRTTTVASIDTYEGPIPEAQAPMSVVLRLADEVDVSRGDMIVRAASAPRVEQRFDAMLVWLHERPLDGEKSYLLKHTTQTVRANVEEVSFVVDLATLSQVGQTQMGLNDIGQVTVRAHRPLYVDDYGTNRATGAFILIDSLTNDTVAAGMVLPARKGAEQRDAREDLERSQVSRAERRERMGHGAAVVVVDGDAAAAFAVERALFDGGYLAVAVSSAEASASCLSAGLVVVLGSDVAKAPGALGSARVVRVTGADARGALRALENGGARGPKRD